jgi:hypothetical protein
VTWQPGPDSGAQSPAWQQSEYVPDAPIAAAPSADSGGRPSGWHWSARQAARWAATVALLGAGLSGLAAAAIGIAIQVLPRHFTVTQQRQIMTWELAGRWRALPAASIFPATVAYRLPAGVVYESGGLVLSARRLGLSDNTACNGAVSGRAEHVLAGAGCSAALRASYVDSSGSFIATVGVAVLPNSEVAAQAAHTLSRLGRNPSFGLRALPLRGSAASRFHDRQRQLSVAVAAGPYVIMSTAGFADGRGRVPLRTDFYYHQEMRSLAYGLARAAGRLLGARPALPQCPGAPGC